MSKLHYHKDRRTYPSAYFLGIVRSGVKFRLVRSFLEGIGQFGAFSAHQKHDLLGIGLIPKL
jgi:hypothetical protein